MSSPGHREFRRAFLVAILAAALAPVLILSIPTAVQLHQLLSAGAQNELGLKSRLAASSIQQEAETVLTRLTALASAGDVQRAARIPTFVRQADPALQGFIERNPSVSSLFFLDRKGRLVTAAPNGLETQLTPEFKRSVAERCLSFRGNKSGFSEFYATPADFSLAGGASALVLSIPVFNPTVEVWSGALCAVVPWQGLVNAAVTKLGTRASVSSLLLDGKPLVQAPSLLEADSIRASIAITSRGFGLENGKLVLNLQEMRWIGLSQFYLWLASLCLISATFVGLLSWFALRFSVRLLPAMQALPTPEPSPSAPKKRRKKPVQANTAPVVIPFPGRD